jgi:hypothetical protein
MSQESKMSDQLDSTDLPAPHAPHCRCYGCANSVAAKLRAPTRYTLAQITRALAETDPGLLTVACLASETDPARLERCVSVAVDRDEAGARSRAEALVARAATRLAK